jgi:MFS family permease
MSVSTDRTPARPINWALTATVFFAGSVLLWADRTNFSVAAAFWAKEYGWTPSTIGLMLSAFSLGYLILQPVGGWIADKIGPRRTLAGAMAGWSLWVLLTPIAPTILWLTATFRVLLGAFEGPYIPASIAAVARAIPQISKRGRFSAFVQSGAQLGPAAGVFFAGLILGATGSPVWIFVIFGLIGLAAAAAWWSYARNFDDPVPDGAHAETAEAKERAAQAPVSPWLLLVTPALWPFYVGYFALPYCQYLFLFWLPQYLSHYRNIPLLQASALSALPFLVAFIAVNFAGWGMDWRLPPQALRRSRRHHLCRNHTDRRDDGVQYARCDHDHHRQCRPVVLRNPVLDDVHRHRAEPDRHAERADELLRHSRGDNLAHPDRGDCAGNWGVRRAAGAGGVHHAGGERHYDPLLPLQAVERTRGGAVA